MFENLGTALIQLLGFFGVFGFFIYQLLTDNKVNNSNNNVGVKQTKTSLTEQKTIKKGLFGRKTIIKENPKPQKKGWFK